MLREIALGRDHALTQFSIFKLGTVLESRGFYEEAEKLLGEAYNGFAKRVGEDHPNTIVVRKQWEECQAKLKGEQAER